MRDDMNLRDERLRCFSMEARATLAQVSPSAHLVALVERCLREPPSRRLDGEIYCALHNVRDLNDLSTDNLLQAWTNGNVLVEYCRGAKIGWVEAPPFTGELKYAETLLPEGVTTICKDPRRVCATALNARALTGAPPLHLSNIFESCCGQR
jgi:hypothetical protein